MAKARRVRTVTSAVVRAQVREDYLAGPTAKACYLAHGFHESALRAQAAREGWRRATKSVRPRGAITAPRDDDPLAQAETVLKGVIQVAALIREVQGMAAGPERNRRGPGRPDDRRFAAGAAVTSGTNDVVVNRRKIRPEAVWAEARKAWESGETARSVSRRYDVGVPALWKRREAEGWTRPDLAETPVEPAEGWAMFAASQYDRMETRLAEERDLAKALVAGMRGRRPENVPLWHLPFVLAWRAEHLGPDVAADDRDRNRDQPWAEVVWDRSGRVRPLAMATLGMVRVHRAVWRAEVGLPDGAAETWP